MARTNKSRFAVIQKRPVYRKTYLHSNISRSSVQSKAQKIKQAFPSTLPHVIFKARVALKLETHAKSNRSAKVRKTELENAYNHNLTKHEQHKSTNEVVLVNNPRRNKGANGFFDPVE